MRTPWSRVPVVLAVAASSVLAQACLLEDEDQPRERRIVLQLDVNPKKIDFKRAVTSQPPADEATKTDGPRPPGKEEDTSKGKAKPEKVAKKGAQKIEDRPRKRRKPKPKYTMEGLLMKLERVKLDRTKRGYHPGELPAVDQAISRAERFLEEERLDEAAREITRAQRALDNFKIDRQYIERRLEVLNRDPRVSRLSGSTLKKVSKLLDGVNRAYLKGDYRKANAIIDRIRRIISKH